MEAVSGESSFSRNSREQDEGRYTSGNLILWIAAIAVLIGLNFASWSFCMWVFGQPEHPMNYRLLTKLEKLDPIHGFLPFTAPRGKFNSAKDLYAQVYPFNETELRAYNGILKRYYLKNYIERDDVTFLSGEFLIESVQEMGPEDVFQHGIVIRARSTTFPDAIVDLALPSEVTPEEFVLPVGSVFRVEESQMCAALLNVERLMDTTMIFTVVPLVTKEPAGNSEEPPGSKTYDFGEKAVITVTTPEKIQIDPERWPISEEVEFIEENPVNRIEVEAEDKPIPVE
ncbi:MAG: hypothetical protein P1U68_15245 [Verrucomicrobiales bacterium]|nr:hypothetical protein [Verrucomicrobiales bacterium]